MSVEDIQRVNKLAQELLDQGFTESREDAVKKAQEMLNKEIVGDNIEIKETDDRQNVASVGNSEERLRNIIERTKEYTEKQFANYKNALIALEREIRALKQEVETLKAKGTNAGKSEEGKPDPADIPQKVSEEEKPDPAEEPQKVEDPANEPQKVEEKSEEQKSDSHPKRGEFNSDDVSVEKMFYFGNK
jgi:hypothetical protein